MVFTHVMRRPYSRFSRDVTAAKLVYRTIGKTVLGIMQNLSDILPLFPTKTWPSDHRSENKNWCTEQWQNVAQALHNNRIEVPKDFFSLLFCTPTWPPWRHIKTKNKDDKLHVNVILPWAKCIFHSISFWAGQQLRQLCRSHKEIVDRHTRHRRQNQCEDTVVNSTWKDMHLSTSKLTILAFTLLLMTNLQSSINVFFTIFAKNAPLSMKSSH